MNVLHDKMKKVKRILFDWNIDMKVILLAIGVEIARFFLNIVYGFMKLRKTKRQVLLLSRQSDKESLDFKLIRQALVKDGIEVVTMYKMIHEGVLSKIGYAFYMFKIMFNLAVSKVCVIDGYSIPVSLLFHKRGQKIIQMWHASGATKKFGYQALDMVEGSKRSTAKIMRMHKNYDYILAPSMATGEFFAEAFNTKKEKIKLIGLPRIEYIRHKDEELKENILFEYPKLRDKKIVLYVPTFRKHKYINAKDLIDNLDFEKYGLIIRKHPLDDENIPYEYTVSSKYMTNDLLKVADYVITDYSAIAYEALATGKPIYFYLYDLDDYMKVRGLNVNLEEEMKSATFRKVKDLLKALESNEYDFAELKAFREKYLSILGQNNIEKFKELIKESL